MKMLGGCVEITLPYLDDDVAREFPQQGALKYTERNTSLGTNRINRTDTTLQRRYLK